MSSWTNESFDKAIYELHDRACKKMTPEEYAEQYKSFGVHTAVSMEIVTGFQEVWVFRGHYVPKLILCPER